MKNLLVAVAVLVTACVSSEEELEQQQAMRNQPGETIEVHDCRPDWFKVGEVCVDPCPGCGGGGDGGGGGGGGGRERDPRGPGPGGGGGGGRPGPGPDPDPGPKPERKECSKDMGLQSCLDCCLYNNTVVDAWECNRKRTRRQREKCWEQANGILKDCQVIVCGRERPIITTGQQ